MIQMAHLAALEAQLGPALITSKEVLLPSAVAVLEPVLVVAAFT